MDEKNIEIRLSNGTLTIRGEKKKEKEEHEQDYCLSEGRYISFTRSFQVPEGVDTGKIEATFAKGVLTVKLPKSAKGWFSAIVIAALLVMGVVTYVY
jgi:HSP20 family protein